MFNLGGFEGGNWDKNARFWHFGASKLGIFQVLKEKIGTKMSDLGIFGVKMLNFGVLEDKNVKFGDVGEENWDKSARFWDF